MSNVIHRLFTEKLGAATASSFIGSSGEIFYDPVDGVLRLSNGSTPGGIIMSSGGGGGGGIANDPSKVLKAGDVMTGLLVLSADPLIPLHAATKQYVDAADALKAPLVHVHDDRYYTEVEVDTKLALYSLTTHNHRLDNLANVEISNLVSDHILKWNGLAWVNAPAPVAGSSTTSNIQTFSTFPAGPTNGSVFVSDTTNTMYYYVAGAWKALDLQDSYLGDNLDVVTTGAIASQVLTFDGSVWRPGNLPTAAVARLSTLPDVNVTGAAANQVLTFDGSVWRAAAVPAASGIALNDLTDVNTAGQFIGQFLGYDGAIWKPTAIPTVTTPSLVGLSDVAIAGLVDGEYIRYDEASNTWVNAAGTYLFDQMQLDPATNILGLGFGEESAPTLTADLSGLVGAKSLDELSDVTIGGEGPAAGQVITWDEASSQWSNIHIANLYPELGQVKDVVITSQANNDILKWDGITSKWVNSPATSGPATAIQISTSWPDNPVQGSVFISDDTDTLYYYIHGEWKLVDQRDYYLSDNLDANTAGATNGQVLTYDAANMIWKPATPVAGGGGTPEAAKAMVTMTTNAIDLSAGAYFKKTITGATTFTVTGAPAAGTVGSFMVELVNPASYITWFSGIKWAGGIVPALTATGTDVLGFTTYDGGVTFIGVLVAKAIA